MNVTITHIEATYVPSLWWMTSDGKKTGVAEWYDTDQEDREYFDPDYEAELANNNYEGEI
jgi:hypothetical protein